MPPGDPWGLQADALETFDPAVLVAADGHPIDFDRDEPLELDSVALGPADAAHLSDVAVSLDGCVVTGCDLSLLTLVVVRNSRIERSKFQGTTFDRVVDHVVFAECTMRECFFRMMTVKRAEFADCSVLACDFYGSTLTHVSFAGSTFEGVGFDQCTVEDVDLTGVADLRIGDPLTLRGVLLGETQIYGFARRLAEQVGIRVAEI